MRVSAAVVCVGLLMISLSGCQLVRLLRIDDVFPGDLDAVDQIVLVDGDAGEKAAISDDEEVRRLIELLRTMRWDVSPDQRLRSGYAYYADFFAGDRHIARLTLWEGRAALTGEYYDLDRAFDTAALRDFFPR